MTDLSCKIDYFRATTNQTGTIAQISERFFTHEATEPAIPLYGYKQSLRHLQSGAIALFGGHTATMGFCSQFAGKAISAVMEQFALSSVPVLAKLHAGAWKVTRLDLAIDVFDPALKPRFVWERVQAGRANTVWRSWRQVANADLDEGHTVYGGSLESEKRIRIYDKSAEQGVKGDWTRYEMVFSGERANEVWRLLSGIQSDALLLTEALRLLGSLLSFDDWHKWRDTFHTPDAAVWVEQPRVESDVRKWLISQVAPTFVKAFDRDGDWRELEWFVERVKRG